MFSAASVAVVKPLYNKLESLILTYKDKALDVLYEKTGLAISYKSLSPSILSGIKLRGINVYDRDSGLSLFTCKKISLSYSLKSLLKKDFDHVFTMLNIMDVNFDYTAKDHPQIESKLEEIINEGSKEEKEAFVFSQEFVEEIKDYLFILPFNVQLRKAQLHFAFDKNDISATVNSLLLQKDEDGVAISCSARGQALASLEALKGQTVGLKIDLNAKILDRIEDSSVFLSVDTHSKADYSLASMEYLFRYGDGIFHLNSIQQSLPYDISISYDVNTSQADLHLSTQNLNPFSLVKMPPLPSPWNKINGSRFSLDGDFSLNTKSLLFSWNAMGRIALSSNLVPGGESVSLNLKGNNSDIYIKSLNATGQMLDASLSGTFNIPSLDPLVTANVNYFTLPNGNQVSGELYLEKQKGKYVAFIPQLFLGEKSFTALQAQAAFKNQALDFSFSVSDYSHYEYSSPAELSLEGLLQMGANPEIQVIVNISNLFADSVMESIAFCLDEDAAASLMQAKENLPPFIMSNQIYISSDFKSLTYNSPYTIIANTKEAKQALLLSFDGTLDNLQISQADLLYNNFNLQAKVSADMDIKNRQFIFTTDFNLNSIPYHLNGSFLDGNWLNLTGNYGFDLMLNIGKTLYGSANFTNLPLSYSDILFYSSMRSTFEYDLEGKSFLENTFKINLENFEIHEDSKKIAFDPKISLSGLMDNFGLKVDSISYSDKTSSLFGSASAVWALTDGTIDSISLKMNMDNPLSEEKISLQGSLTSPLKESGSGAEKVSMGKIETTLTGKSESKNQEQNQVENQKQNQSEKSSKEISLLDYKLLLTADLAQIAMNRFMSGQYDDDTLNAFLRVDGTLKNPYAALNIQRFRCEMNGVPLTAGGVITFEIKNDSEWNLDLTNLYAHYNFAQISSFTGSLNLKSFNGNFTSQALLTLGDKDLRIPLTIKLSNLSPSSENFFPDLLKINLTSPAMTGSLLQDKIPLDFEIVRMKGMWTFKSDDNMGITGFYTDNGGISLKINESKPLHFNLSGNIEFAKNALNLKLSDFYLDAAQFAKYFNSSYFSLYSGLIDGYIDLSGVFTDPYLDGQLNVMNLDFNLPDFIPEHFTSKGFSLNMTQDDITLKDSVFSIKNTDLLVDAEVILDRWSLDKLNFTAKTTGDSGIPLDAKVPLVSAKGNLGLDLEMSYNGDDLDVKGSLSLDKSEITVLDTTKLGSLNQDKGDSSGESKKTSSSSSSKSSLNVNADVTLLIGQKVHFVVNPIVRALIAPGTPVNLTLNTAEGLWTVKGDVVLRGGEVSYLNRNFYLKEGRIILDENQDAFDPNITIRAETREHDENGDSVTISLSAVRQNISNFNPSLYSTPAKSLNEIYQLLGQAVVGDSEDVGGLLLSTLDYGVQVTVLRKLENSLRDLFNFDIFSIRTALLQNTIKQSLNMNSNSDKAYSIGNYFDNSTVYIGKYFGESVYLDAMMHWNYDELAQESGESSTGLVFQPEIGLELSSPFANIRWNFAPDLKDLQNSFVNGNSITLSWRLSF